MSRLFLQINELEVIPAVIPAKGTVEKPSNTVIVSRFAGEGSVRIRSCSYFITKTSAPHPPSFTRPNPP